MNFFGLWRCEYSGNACLAVAKAANNTARGDLLVLAMNPLRMLAAPRFSYQWQDFYRAVLTLFLIRKFRSSVAYSEIIEVDGSTIC